MMKFHDLRSDVKNEGSRLQKKDHNLFRSLDHRSLYALAKEFDRTLDINLNNAETYF